MPCGAVAETHHPTVTTPHVGPASRMIGMNPRRIARLRNQRCPYCGRGLTDTNRDIDHLIGRRFVPKGSLAASWNLLLNAHRECNAEKGALESDLSAITLHMLSVSHSVDPAERQHLQSEIDRKSKTTSSVTKRHVGESHETHEIKHSFGAMNLSFTLSAPPRLSPEGVLKLAALHTRGLSAIVFTNNEIGDFSYLPPSLVLAVEVTRSDWGNTRAMAFMNTTREWPHRFIGTNLAAGYFQAMVRKEPGDRPIWAWALEWNRMVRLMGYMGDNMADLEQLARALPPVDWQHEWEEQDPVRGKIVTRLKLETPLPGDEDHLFSAPRT
jgi:hypothetical protein